jgi:hypothetical protein
VKIRAYSVVAAVPLVIVAGVTLRAQEQSAQASASAQGTATAEPARNRALASIVPLKLSVVLSRYRGDRKIASDPYELSVRTDGSKASIRMATPPQLLPPPTPPAAAGAQPAPRPTLFTNIDCSANNLDIGRFAVTVTIEDSSIYDDNQRTGNGSKTESTKSVRMFRTTNALVLRDGQSTEFTAATDKANGEVIKAAVTLTVVK